MKWAVYFTATGEETIGLGERLASEWSVPLTIVLIGELGAGKTTLAKGLAAGFGAARPEEVSSPTFPLIHEYGDPVTVYHVDLYRLETAGQVEGLGLDDIFARPAAVLLEWAERFPAVLPKSRIEIRITPVQSGQDAETRRIEVLEVKG